MIYIPGSFYHIYNRGNNKQTIFFQERNYQYFIDKVRKYIVGYCDLMARCLMPNHFHFLLRANDRTSEIVKTSPIRINRLTENFRLLLSSYSLGIQKQQRTSGSLFQQRTKFKCVDRYLDTAFHYIHQNPLKAGLTSGLENWKWSSFNEYLNLPSTGICNQEVTNQYLNLDRKRFLIDSYGVIPEQYVEKIL